MILWLSLRLSMGDRSPGFVLWLLGMLSLGDGLTPASVCSTVRGCLSLVYQSLHVLFLCSYGLSLATQCALPTALSVRELEETWVPYRLKFYADQTAYIVHQILRCCVPPQYVFCPLLNLVHSGNRNCCYYSFIFSFIAPTLFIFLPGEPSLWSADV